MDEFELRELANDVADEKDIELDKVKVFKDSLGNQTVQVVKYINGEKYASEVSFDKDMDAVRNLFHHQLDHAVQSIIDRFTTEYRVNDHILRVKTLDGFHAEAIPASHEWHVETETPTTVLMGGEEVIPDHLVKAMQMYLVGWALEHDVREARDAVYERNQHMADPDAAITERFKYLPD